ncbi:hypothetical protein DPMN_172300 [Dreissena polymorpha]|uniref:Uncharacterized protein n=1 Tax=Dreissena polymorpha TaxID=45954 RepID=A0A9D4E2V3_DREPO|nr:hypothetical protein DPMN_172300 [Dreissena polymorpha]
MRNLDFSVWRDLDGIRWWDLHSSHWRDLNGSQCRDLNLILAGGGTWKAGAGATCTIDAACVPLLLRISYAS